MIMKRKDVDRTNKKLNKKDEHRSIIVLKQKDEINPRTNIRIEKSINFNVNIAKQKIRFFVCKKSLLSFVKGDTRITVKKSALIRKRQLNKIGFID